MWGVKIKMLERGCGNDMLLGWKTKNEMTDGLKSHKWLMEGVDIYTPFKPNIIV